MALFSVQTAQVQAGGCWLCQEVRVVIRPVYTRRRYRWAKEWIKEWTKEWIKEEPDSC